MKKDLYDFSCLWELPQVCFSLHLPKIFSVFVVGVRVSRVSNTVTGNVDRITTELTPGHPQSGHGPVLGVPYIYDGEGTENCSRLLVGDTQY